jgi:hypothetical protein
MICWIRRRHWSRASPARRTTWKGFMTATASGSSSAVAVLKPGGAVDRDDLDPAPPGRVADTEPLFERLFGTAFDHVEQPGGSGVVADPGEIDDHVLVAAAGVPPVGWARGAVTALPLFRFHGPPAEPVVRLSPQRALHARATGPRSTSIGPRRASIVSDDPAATGFSTDTHLRSRHHPCWISEHLPAAWPGSRAGSTTGSA